MTLRVATETFVQHFLIQSFSYARACAFAHVYSLWASIWNDAKMFGVSRPTVFGRGNTIVYIKDLM